MQNLESAVRVPLLSASETGEVYSRLRLDHPEIFYLTGYRIRYANGASYGELLPEYLFDKSKILSHRQAIKARIERLTRDEKGKSEAEKLQFIHRFITENVRYDKLEKPYSHEIIGPLTQGVGVCEGIAKTVKMLADSLGVECVVALSNPEEGKKYGHAWNVIKRGGKWYHMDATFDLSLGKCGETRWDYYLLSDSQIYRDHAKPAYPVPECSDNGSFYYKEQKLSFTKTEDLFKRVAQSAKKKKPRFIFHWRGGYLTRETLSELVKIITSAAESEGKFASLSLNYPQAVFAVSFLEKQSAAENITLETADESE